MLMCLGWDLGYFAMGLLIRFKTNFSFCAFHIKLKFCVSKSSCDHMTVYAIRLLLKVFHFTLRRPDS